MDYHEKKPLYILFFLFFWSQLLYIQWAGEMPKYCIGHTSTQKDHATCLYNSNRVGSDLEWNRASCILIDTI